MALSRRIRFIVFSAIRFIADSLIVTLSVPLLILQWLPVAIRKQRETGNSPCKVLLGVQEVASNLHSIQKCLDHFGIETTAIIRNNKYSGPGQFGPAGHGSRRHYINPVRFRVIDTALLFPFLKAYYFLKYFCSHDIIWIIWNETFLPWGLDLLISRIAGKKLILMHCGDDVRYRPMQRVIDREFNFQTWQQDQPNSGSFLAKFFYAKLSQVCGTVLSLRNQSTFQESSSVMFRFPMPGSLAEPRKPGRIVRIVHAPSCRNTKATAIVLEAIGQLNGSDLPFEFHLLEDQRNDLVLSILGESEILIDQPGDWVGRLAIEACAASCCVIGGNMADYNNQFESPIIQFEREASHLAAILKDLIKDRELLEAGMSRCFAFWKNCYSEEAFFHFFQDLLRDQAKTFLPLKNQKQLLLTAAAGPLEKSFIQLFYHPRSD